MHQPPRRPAGGLHEPAPTAVGCNRACRLAGTDGGCSGPARQELQNGLLEPEIGGSDAALSTVAGAKAHLIPLLAPATPRLDGAAAADAVFLSGVSRWRHGAFVQSPSDPLGRRYTEG